MSLEALKNDLKQNLVELAQLNENLATPSDIVKHLKGTLWPMIESVVDELGEVDDILGDIVNDAEDILQPETAGVFSAVLMGATAVTAALKTKVTREQDPGLYQVIDELEKNIKQAGQILEDVAIDDGEDDLEDDDDADDEDDDDQEDA